MKEYLKEITSLILGDGNLTTSTTSSKKRLINYYTTDIYIMVPICSVTLLSSDHSHECSLKKDRYGLKLGKHLTVKKIQRNISKSQLSDRRILQLKNISQKTAVNINNKKEIIRSFYHHLLERVVYQKLL